MRRTRCKVPLELKPLLKEMSKFHSFKSFLHVATKSYMPEGDRSRTPDKVIEMRKEGGLLKDYDERTKQDWFGRADPKYRTPVPRDGEKIPIYRATEGPYIRPGDYVTQSRAYAKLHLDAVLRGEGRILKTTATTDDLLPLNENEFIWVPKSFEALGGLHGLWSCAKGRKQRKSR